MDTRHFYILLFLVSVCISSDVSHAQYQSRLLDPVSLKWYFQYGKTTDGYADKWQSYKDMGQMPVDIETDIISGATRYSGVWQENKDDRGWVSFRNLTDEVFHEKWLEYKDRNYRPIDQDTSIVEGKVRYSLVMVKNTENLKWISNRNLNNQQFSERFNQYKDQYLPIDVDAVNINGNMHYSIIWEENKSNIPWAEFRNMTPESYGEKFIHYKERGYRVTDLDCYGNADGDLRYIAIWEKNPPGRAWAAYRQMNSIEFKNRWKQLRDQGMRVIDIEICPKSRGSGVQYAAVWRENGNRFDWGGRKSIEAEMDQYIENSDAPSVAVAVMRNGRLLFKGGRGEADTEEGVWAHGETVYRLASVSKPITGVLGYVLEEAGLVNLDDRTDTHIPELGSDHTHTIRRLIEMRGCVSHYKSDGVNDNDTQVNYSLQLSALNNHMNGAIGENGFIINPCSQGNYNYSTHSYTVAAAALEAASNDTFNNLVETYISDPFDLDTMRVETRISPDPSGDLAEIHNNGSRVSSDDFRNVTWKAAGGGIESSVKDLVTFGDRVLRNRYFPEAIRDAMWNGRSGWNANGTRYEKSGGQQSADSYLIVDTDTNTVVAVAANERLPTIDTEVLANTVFNIATAN